MCLSTPTRYRTLTRPWFTHSQGPHQKNNVNPRPGKNHYFINLSRM